MKISNLLEHKHFKLYLSIFVAAVYFCGIHYLSECERIFQYGFDEGYYFMRAFLHMKGFDLYKDIMIDQPPGLPKMLYFAFKLFGPSVGAGRSVVLLLVSLMLGSLFYMISKTQNVFSAFVTMVLICSIPNFVKLSVSAMNGLPAIALAVISCLGVYWYETRRQRGFLLLSAFLLALGLQTKLFVVVFIPAIAAELFFFEYQQDTGKPAPKHFRSVCFWALCLLAVYLTIAWSLGVHYSQIIRPYSLAKDHFSEEPFVKVFSWLTRNSGISLLALGAFVWPRAKPMTFVLIPLLATIGSFLLFVYHRPIWYHHRMLMMVPAAWLASYGVSEFFSLLNWRSFKKETTPKKRWMIFKRVYLAGALLYVTLHFTSNAYSAKWSMYDTTPPEVYDVIELIRKNKTADSVLLTDTPNMAFHARVLMPPSLATFSGKHVKTGIITEESLVRTINSENVDMIVWYRFPKLGEKVMRRVGDRYELVYQNDYRHLKLYFQKKGP
ncbi:MAG: glycosyltransferase family 39 protein [Candidatus Omnitrophica bacterium]|nr:glycosyltransferase family 39 protein [Candidatus Omnitrophota bacterium]